VGRSGLWVSEVGLGLWKWGDPSYDGSRVGEHEGFKILDRALELGVFFWDTANSYNWGSGNSERLIGRYFASRGRRIREQVVLATKIANPVREEHEEEADFTPNQRGASRLYIRRAVEGCLRRLQTDYIDLLYVHYPVLDERGEYETPLEETWGTLDDLIFEGVVCYLGVSNYNIKQIEEAQRALRGVAKDASRRIVAVQNPYNLLERKAISKEENISEAEFLRYIREAEIGLVPCFPLAAGMLTGKYRRENIEG
jgi:aryl-alcohol dehydrogenase-like predicted oxidoreductase